MMDLYQNLNWARKAVQYTKQSLPTGASNKPFTGIGAVMCVQMMRRAPSTTRKETKYDYIRSWAVRARHFGCGNCAEQAAVAFVYLDDNGIRPIHYMAVLDKGDHGFVVIGRNPNSRDGDVDSWGGNAVICDPWYGKSYPAGQGGKEMQKIKYAKTIWSL